MKTIKDHWEDQAKAYDHFILNLCPFYPSMIGYLVDLLPGKGGRPRILDIGSGTGMVTQKLKERFPEALVTCVDIAINMTDVAKQRLINTGGIEFVLGDICDVPLDKGRYDAVVSSLTLHHIPDAERKREVYQKIFDALAPSGVFYNADIVKGSNDRLHDYYLEQWQAYMRRKISQKEIDEKWLPRHRDTDHPMRMMDEIGWLKDIGFVDVDVVWKYFHTAIYGGEKGN